MQPTPVLSLGSDLRSPSLSSQPPPAPVGEEISLSGWWVLVGTGPLCRIPLLCPPHSCCCALLRGSKASPPPTPCLRPQRGFLVCGNFSSFTVPSPRCRFHPYSFVSVFSFFFCPTQVRGEFLAFWEVWGLLALFSIKSNTVLHYPWMVGSMATELLIQKADCKVTWLCRDLCP